MAWVAGGPSKAHHPTRNPVSPQHFSAKVTEVGLAMFAGDTLAGLAHMHDLGHLHRDLKLANMLYSDRFICGLCPQPNAVGPVAGAGPGTPGGRAACPKRGRRQGPIYAPVCERLAGSA